MNPRMQNFERDSLKAVLNSKRVWLVQVVANALLMIAFYYWTRIPDENGAQFALSVIGGLIIVFLTLWLHSATFEFFASGPESSFKVALRRVLARTPGFLVWAVVFGGVLWLLSTLWQYDEQAGGWLRHTLPEFLRKNVKPRSMITLVTWSVGFLVFLLWPIIFLPVGAEVAKSGLRGFIRGAAWRPFREIRFWVVYVVCFVAGGYLSYSLAWMTPTKPSSLAAQKFSLALRLGIGYLLLVTAWLVVCAAIVRTIAAFHRDSSVQDGATAKSD